MNSLFTDPLPDELLFSACSRFSDKVRYPNKESTAEVLFGNKNAAAVVDLPSRLDHFVAALPPYHQYTADALIDENTLLPYYAPFLPLERNRIVRNNMRGNADNRIRISLGSAIGQVQVPSHLRFCPNCAQEDREKFGKTYWHRTHQATGVEVCPYHRVFLESSSIPWQESKRSGKYASAEKIVQPGTPHRLDPLNRQHSLLLKIAQNVAWLLNWQGPAPGSKLLRERYYNLLLERGYAFYNGRIKTTKLLKNFIGFYTSELLALLQCEIKKDVHEPWLLRIVRNHKDMIAQHPLRHLLLIIFLGCTAEKVFTRFTEFKPFGDCPWPCLNRASPHFQQPVITECHVTDSIAKRKHGVPMGTFVCSCGFIYTRRGPDSSEQDRFRFDNVTAYGPVWENTLREQWQDPSLPVYEIARNLGVIPFTVKRHAIRLNLPFPRQSRNSVPINQKILDEYSNTRDTLEDALPTRRSEWISVIEENPEAGRRQLQSLASYTYWWLRKHDPEWLKAHMPKSRKPPPRPRRVDWNKADIELSLEVEKTAKSIMQAEGRPIQVTLSEISRRVGHKNWLERRLDKLPLTEAKLTEYLEPFEDYSIRRVRWAAECYRKEEILPKPYQLERRASAHYEKGKTPKVESAIQTALASLSAELSQ